MIGTYTVYFRLDPEWYAANGDQPVSTDHPVWKDRLGEFVDQDVTTFSAGQFGDDASEERVREAFEAEMLDMWPTVPASAWIVDDVSFEFDTSEFEALLEDE